ncbi:NADP-dependent oxidoreductase [Nonomuraea sp. K274]|uniref:NADP-dependent oxidoreductase n=1 Tax=Nonomuraea cypriaca TaxID=1187855 RepID=A0A931F3Q3_9ACTN|nr:NADP-dependent oxidoreductase [Nonomuraea cypriaca]MBF8191857.1 NADP-dependent oxidoreductase [Nonomuraea cypriaca]
MMDMKALVARSYGPPELLRIDDLPIPEPGPGQVQVKVAAASLNPADLLMTGGAVRDLFETVFPYVPGTDFAGTVTRVGPGVERFGIGDEVFGFGVPPLYAERMGVSAVTSGALAEYATFQADGPFVAPRPEGLAPGTAAALASTGMTAAAALADGDFQPGERVLVIGATGGVGSIVVPLLAKERKAEVIATAIPEYAAYAHDLGAAETIDYLSADVGEETLRRHPGGVDAIVNLVLDGARLAAAARALRPGGRLLTTTPGSLGHDGLRRDDITVRVVHGPPGIRPDTFPTLAARALDGTLVDMISRGYRFGEAARALTDLASAPHTRGKFVVSMP